MENEIIERLKAMMFNEIEEYISDMTEEEIAELVGSYIKTIVRVRGVLMEIDNVTK